MSRWTYYHISVVESRSSVAALPPSSPPLAVVFTNSAPPTLHLQNRPPSNEARTGFDSIFCSKRTQLWDDGGDQRETLPYGANSQWGGKQPCARLPPPPPPPLTPHPRRRNLTPQKKRKTKRSAGGAGEHRWRRAPPKLISSLEITNAQSCVCVRARAEHAATPLLFLY